MSMTMNSSTSYSSMKSVVFVVVLLVLLVSSEFSGVNGRPLRSMMATTDIVGIERGSEGQGGADGGRVSTFVVSAINSRSHNSFRSLAFMLASGPSKKGPGH